MEEEKKMWKVDTHSMSTDGIISLFLIEIYLCYLGR